MCKIVIPADIQALVDIGVDKWHSEASWPVGEEEFSNFASNICQSFGEFLNTTRPEMQDIFLADINFVGFLGQYFHAAVVTERSNRASVAVSYSDLARPFYEPNWSALATANRASFSAFEKAMFRPREAVRRFRFNSQLSPLQRCLSIFRSSQYWSLGALNEDKHEYLGSSKLWVEIPYLERFLTKVSKLSESQERELLQAVDQCLDKICSRASMLVDLSLPLADITRTWVARLTDVYEQYLAVMASKRSAKLVLASGLGNTANRIMALAAKRKGAHVVAFSHGNDTCMIESIVTPYLEYAICNEFVSISQSLADFHTKQQRQVGWNFCSETTFSSLETVKYQDQFKSRAPGQSRASGQAPIKSVMLAGYPMHPQRYLYGTGDFFPFRLSAELDTVRILREAGYRVLYKPHPETQQITSEIMRSRVDQIIHDPFEVVMDRADCIVFTYTITTTLGAALATDVPIVLFEHKGRPWNKDAYEKLKLRCAMVPTSLDSNGRNALLEADLLDAITRAPSLMDQSYLNEFMSPASLTT